jgi:CYTH domain-containing protein
VRSGLDQRANGTFATQTSLESTDQFEVPMTLEPELKFRIAKSKLGKMRLAGMHAGESEKSQLVSTYFYTPKQKLHHRRLTLRVRQNRRSICVDSQIGRDGKFCARRMGEGSCECFA